MNAASSEVYLLADVPGSFALHQKLGAAESGRALERCLNRAARAAETQQGNVVPAGQARIAVVFAGADTAVFGACEMQQRVDSLPPVSGVKLSLRAAIGVGTPGVRAEGALPEAASGALAQLLQGAKAGEVLLGEDVLALLGAGVQRLTREVVSVAGPGRCFEVAWQSSEAVAAAVASAAQRSTGLSARLVVRHAGREVTVDGERPAISLGRDPRNDLVIEDRRASRLHARIERRGERYVLIDASTNGTYVRFTGEPDFLLKGEEVTLRGRGRLTFGNRAEASEIVDFMILG